MNTSISELIQYVESQTFDIQMNVFSGFNSFYEALTEDSRVITLMRMSRENAEALASVVSRINVLLKEALDNPEYAAPHDAALAAYFHVIEQSYLKLSISRLEVLSRLPFLWWSRHMALRLLQQRKAETASVIVAPIKGKSQSVAWQTVVGLQSRIQYSPPDTYASSAVLVSGAKSSSRTTRIDPMTIPAYRPYGITS